MIGPDQLRTYLLDAIASVVPPRGGAYVAGPLATGRRYYEMLASGEDTGSIRDLNEREMRNFIGSLRMQLSYPVIDPGWLKIPIWTSAETGEFYLEVIDRFAKELWFMDGWEYSRGATKEFQFAMLNGLSCYDARGERLSAERGVQLISDVVSTLAALGIDCSRFNERLRHLDPERLGRS